MTAGAAQWRPIESAPKDGSRIALLIEHLNAKYSQRPVAEGWLLATTGSWIDFNGGGWTWSGMAGDPVGWMPLEVCRHEYIAVPLVPGRFSSPLKVVCRLCGLTPDGPPEPAPELVAQYVYASPIFTMAIDALNKVKAWRDCDANDGFPGDVREQIDAVLMAYELRAARARGDAK